MRVTWTGYEFFGTLSLGVYLIQVDYNDMIFDI